jgi:carbon-monoxide dehydrogenase large subunit
MRPMKFGVGQAVRRVEDPRLITGQGRYTDDHHPDGLAHAVVVRSPHAHARFRIADLDAARALPGVLLVLTHEDIAHLGTMPCPGVVKNADGSDMAVPPHHLLARDTVRHVGDTVAFVVAETLDQARDAAEAIAIDWEALDAVVGIEAASTDGAPLIWPDRPGNLAFDAEIGSREATDAAFARADRVVSLTIANNRLVTNYLEPRGCVAEYDTAKSRWTITLGSQGSHAIREAIAPILKVERDRMRVVTPDVGGGFGTKLFPFREYPLCAFAAERLKRPVKWV